MVIDTSALVALLLSEPKADALLEALLTADTVFLSAATVVEAGIVMQARYGADGASRLDRLLVQLGAELVPLTTIHADLARQAFRRYGKGQHPAGLNYGDCFSYALAAALGEPLLFVGEDFSQTDIPAATY